MTDTESARSVLGSDDVIGAFSGEYRFLSNFWLAQVEYEGVVYPSAEHAYQAAKSPDAAYRRQIADLSTPGKAKRAGQGSPDGWRDGPGCMAMYDIVAAKFTDPELARMLRATGDRLLVEGNGWHDTYWGVCSCGDCPAGQNLLGLILMLVRDTLRADADGSWNSGQRPLTGHAGEGR